MTFGKWISLGVGVVCALLTAALLLFNPAPSLGGGLTGPVSVILIAALIGVMFGIVHWLVFSRFEAELRQLIGHIEAVSRRDDADMTYRSRLGLGALAGAVHAALSRLRQRNEQLTARRRELEVQLRIAEAERCHAEAILNTISDAVIVTDAYDELTMANDAAARVLEFDLRESRRRPIEQVLADSTLVKLIKDTREGAPAPARCRKSEHRLVHGEKEEVYSVTVCGLSGRVDEPGETALAQGPDEPRGVVTVLRDVTRERAVAEMKRDFVSSVSHELRTPLSSIKAYVEMLVDGEAHDDQTRAEFYNIIQGETNRLSRLIDNILNINRIESGVVRIQRELLSLTALVREVAEVMRPQARAKGIELTEVAPPVFFQVFGDRDMLHQATLNLVGNAIKYTGPAGKVAVTVSVDSPNRLVHVSVADTGVGIPPQDLPHVFDKFYRVDGHKKLAKGTGLGLSLVHQIIETVHGGTVTVKSEVGQGTTFTYSLPLAESV